MKELSIEEKAKAYDEAIKIANEYFNSPRTCVDIDILSKLFPELANSEDERIIKSIICALKQYYIANTVFYGFSREDMIAWLEKQCESSDISGRYKNDYGKNYVEQKSAWSEEDNYSIEILLCLLDNEKENYPRLSSYVQDIEKTYKWLKSLKERYTWKPSEFQLGSISDAIIRYEAQGINAVALKELFEQLKKLREK